MDAFDAILSDPEWSGTTKTKAPAFDSSQTYGTPSKILDNLAQIESSGNPTAINPQTKALGTYQFLPETVASLYNQGVKFNPFDPNESRAAADYYLSQLAQQNGGDYAKALAQYGGFKKKDPSSYVNRAMAGVTPESGLSPYIETHSQPADVFDAILSDPEGKNWTPKAQEQAKGAESSGLVSQIPGIPGYTPQAAAPEANPIIGIPPAVLSTLFNAAAMVPATLYGVGKQIATGQFGTPKGGSYAQQEAEKAMQLIGIQPTAEGQAALSYAQPVLENLGALAGHPELAGMAATLGGPMVAGAATRLPTKTAGRILGEVTAPFTEPFKAASEFLTPQAPTVFTSPELQAQGAIIAGRQRAIQMRNGYPPEIPEPTPTPIAPAGSVGAAGVTPEAMATQASPELQAAVKKFGGNVNPEVLARHVDADTLPEPIKLTTGQATRDPNKWADEWNFRDQDAAFRANQNKTLTRNIDLIEDRARPDVMAANAVEDGDNLINAYKAYDAPIKDNINQLYTKLRDANGGDFPIDSVTFADNAKAALKADMSTDFLPAQFSKMLDSYAEGAPMTFSDFETMRTRLAAESRKAARSGDGNMEHALSVVRDQLEALPIKDTAAAEVKPLADAARAAASQRFQEIANDPAYKAALNDVDPDKFAQKYVINGTRDNVAEMAQKFQNIPDMPEAPQFLSAAGLRYLKNQAVKGVAGEEKWTGQASFNKAIKQLQDTNKFQTIFDPKTAEDLNKLGKVAAYIEMPPPGAVINTSGTASVLARVLGGATGAAGKALEQGTNLAFGGKFGVPVGTIVKEQVKGVKERSAARKRVEPFKGLDYKGAQTGSTSISGLK